jgi:hypothetical protein
MAAMRLLGSRAITIPEMSFVFSSVITGIETAQWTSSGNYRTSHFRFADRSEARVPFVRGDMISHAPKWLLPRFFAVTGPWPQSVPLSIFATAGGQSRRIRIRETVMDDSLSFDGTGFARFLPEFSGYFKSGPDISRENIHEIVGLD